jgi:hypothetical protein
MNSQWCVNREKIETRGNNHRSSSENPVGRRSEMREPRRIGLDLGRGGGGWRWERHERVYEGVDGSEPLKNKNTLKLSRTVGQGLRGSLT